MSVGLAVRLACEIMGTDQFSVIIVLNLESVLCHPDLIFQLSPIAYRNLLPVSFCKINCISSILISTYSSTLP